MRNWIALLLLIPMCLLTISGTAESSNKDMIVPTEEATLATTEPTIEEIIEETTESTTPVMTEPTVEETEPIVTEPEKQEPNLISLGRFKLTAYCSCAKCCGKYALNRPLDNNGNEIVFGSIGVVLEAGVSIAVDPGVIPYGTQVMINGHTYTAQDTGGSIKGNIIDIYFDNHEETVVFGVQYAEVFIYESQN